VKGLKGKPTNQVKHHRLSLIGIVEEQEALVFFDRVSRLFKRQPGPVLGIHQFVCQGAEVQTIQLMQKLFHLLVDFGF